MAKSKQQNDKLKAAFGDAVKARRKKLKISQDELAWRAAVHRTYISNVERGVCNPALSSVAKIAKALGINAADLLNDVASAANPQRGAPVDILLVEDQANDAELTIEALKKAGLANTVHVARDGAAALDYFFGKNSQLNGHPRLILLDLELPKVSGLEVLQKLKADERTASIPVIVLTGSRVDRDSSECRRLGANFYIVKPVNFQNLSEVTPQLNLCWLLLPCPAAAAA